MHQLGNARITQLSIHKAGSRSANEDLLLAGEPTDLSDDELTQYLLHYFLNPFKSEEYFQFTFSNDQLSLNPMYQMVSKAFYGEEDLHDLSKDIASYLYDCSLHPNIKGGEIFIAMLEDVMFNGESINALGIFKAEERDTFLVLEEGKRSYELSYKLGFPINKLDKGCIIFNVEAEDGYKMCLVDRNSKNAETQYWKEKFLNVRTCVDKFHHTQNYLSLARSYVTKALPDEFEVNKVEQADFLNKSINYFKKNEVFAEKDFVETVFESPTVIESFQNFKETFQEATQTVIEDSFEISKSAAKQQNKVFKSVIKLDKNFHIYVHGNRELIEQGVDPKSGKKFYKIFYDEETT